VTFARNRLAMRLCVPVAVFIMSLRSVSLSRISLNCCVLYASIALATAQTSSTGAISGVVLDRTGAVVPGALVSLLTEEGTHLRSSVSDKAGLFSLASIRPGTYELRASKADFKPSTIRPVHVRVTETIRLELHLQLTAAIEHTEVLEMPQTVLRDGSALGRNANEETIHETPLATRNFSQLVALSPGVLTGVYNAGELGIGGTGLSQISPSNDGVFVHGTRSYDNNWQLDGISVSDVLSASTASGGIPVPNPDALSEVSVQTGLYSAAFGRAVGSNVSVITKTGTNHYHATLFEFVRNDVLNANDFFLNRLGHQRPALKQNQFGFTIGGPVHIHNLFFFGSYQGTRQINGVAAGQARIGCSATLYVPALTNDRSAAALGSLFGGMSGALGGVTVNSAGSNINPAALAILNLKLSDGSFLIPTPQRIDTSRPFAAQGVSIFSQPCHFDENQLLANLDYNASERSQFSTRMFLSQSDQVVTFPGNGRVVSGNIPAFNSPGATHFLVFSLAHTYVLNSAQANQARIAFVRTSSQAGAHSPFSWSDVGVSEGTMNDNDELPSLQILGSVSMAPAFPRTYIQNSYVLDDVFTSIVGAHSMQFGASLTHLRDPLHFAGFNSFVQFLSWPDFLLGMNAGGNGTQFSNVFQSADGYGLFDRDFRAWEASAFVQDDYRINDSLTLNLGVRYERPGQFGDNLGRNASFDAGKADPSPPPGGSLDGYLVASNFPGIPPPGVTRVSNEAATYGDGQHTIAPRIGFAWRFLPHTSRFLLRGGYGIFYSRPTGQSFTASVLAAPFGVTRTSTGIANAAATLQAPFAQPFPTSNSFPMFPPYSQSSHVSVNVLAPNFRPAAVQQFSLNTQAALKQNWLLEIGYVGTVGTHLQRFRSLNQALYASPSRPVRGVTSNTVSNIGLRVPIPGMLPDGVREMESAGRSWYSGLETSLTKRFGYGLQLLVSYTFSKTLDTDGANINGTSGVNTLTLGDQTSPTQRWGRASFDRTHRFVLSGTWRLPNPPSRSRRMVLGGWQAAGVITIQSGTALTVADTNASNVFGINEDRAQLSGACSKSQLVSSGSIRSKLNSYFARSCFTSPPIIGADGVGTGFGDSGTGIVNGPGQANLDIAISKSFGVNWPSENASIQFRAEFYNALNHPQFANPDSNFTSPTFGVISSSAVNPRVGQLALKMGF